MKNKGFTLLETIIAAGIFMILSLLAMNILVYASNASNVVLVRHELLENARIAMDSIITNVQKAKAVELEKSPDGMLAQLTLTEYQPSSGLDHKYKYVYFGERSDRYHQLEFGGNELAKYIKHIYVDIGDDIMTIEILTDASIDGVKGSIEPLTLKGAVSMRYKEIGFIK